jgi:hypothetical protein
MFECFEDWRDIVALNLRPPCRDEIATTPQELDVWGRMRPCFILTCHGQGSKALVLHSFGGVVQGYKDMTSSVTMMTCSREIDSLSYISKNLLESQLSTDRSHASNIADQETVPRSRFVSR